MTALDTNLAGAQRVKQTRAEHAEQFLEFVWNDCDVLELRVLSSAGCTHSGLFTNLKAAAKESERIARKDNNIYFTLNPVRRTSDYFRSMERKGLINRIHRHRSTLKQTAGDADMDRRTLFLIDCDPEREKGKAATDAQKKAASAVADNVEAYLLSLGWPMPLRADSGNGIHLYFRGNGQFEFTDWRTALKVLAQKFNTADAKVDTSVFNPARISRLPGSMNRKASAPTPDRPHRACRVLKYPDTWIAVTDEQVNALATEASEFPDAGRRMHNLPHTSDSSFMGSVAIGEQDVLDFIEEYADILHLGRITPKDEVTYFELLECPFAGRAHLGQGAGAGKTALLYIRA
jgi:hypothetical protein